MPSSSTTTLQLLVPISILTLAFLIPIAFGNHNPQPCSDDFEKYTKQKGIPHCKKLRTLGAEFGWNIFHNNVTNNNNYTQIQILFRARLKTSKGWIAWGVNPGKPQMVGAKAIVGIKHAEESTFQTKTYDITKETRTGCRLIPTDNLGGINVTHMVAESYGATYYGVLSATLLLPSDQYDVTRLNHIWQVGYDAEGDEPKRHKTTLQNVDSTETINLTTPTGLSTGQSRGLLRRVHGALNIIGWGTLLPIGVIIARYFRVYPFLWNRVWFYLHIGFQLSGFLIGTVGWVIGLSLGSASKYYTLHTHRTFGIFIFTFSTIQMLAFRLKPKLTDDYRKYWNMYHHFLGYGLITIIIINIFKGISILKGGCGWRWAYIGILILLGAITFVFEIITWIRFMIKPNESIIIGTKLDNKHNVPKPQAKEPKK